MIEQARMFVRYASGLRHFLGSQLSEPECTRMVTAQLANRESAFLDILRRGICENPRSPYLKLLEHAGIGLPDVERTMSRLGLEGALRELHARGVYVTIEEFKGRKPIRRGHLVFAPDPGDFDNPLLLGHYESRTGGSRGTRLVVDLDLLDYEAAQTIFLSQFGLNHAGRHVA
jgi:hypothetical protein